MAKVLYISLNGMTEALGESQVVQYLLDLVKMHAIYLLSFEKQQDQKKYSEMRTRLEEVGIRWDFFVYSNRYGVLSSIWQVIIALCVLIKWVRREKIEIVHARSLIPGVMGLLLKKIFKIKFLFDIRGFALEEKIVDGRLKRDALLTQILLKLESLVYKNADHIVTLTHVSKPIIHERYGVSDHQITVIPTCANPEVFKRMSAAETLDFRWSLGFDQDDFILLHSGSVNGWVDFEAECLLFKALHLLHPQIKWLILNNGQHESIEALLLKYGVDSGYGLRAASFKEVYQYLNVADASLFFIKPCFAKQASAPTKFAENVSCHLFSITNQGYGDMTHYLSEYPDVGLLLDLQRVRDDPRGEAQKLWEKLQKREQPGRFSSLFRVHFSKKTAVGRYDQIYRDLAGTIR